MVLQFFHRRAEQDNAQVEEFHVVKLSDPHAVFDAVLTSCVEYGFFGSLLNVLHHLMLVPNSEPVHSKSVGGGAVSR